MSKAMYRERLQEKLLAKSQKDPLTGCWIWLGQVSNSGHGRITIRDRVQSINKVVSAETASYIAFVEAVPEGALVRQNCASSLCINPEHLSIEYILET